MSGSHRPVLDNLLGGLNNALGQFRLQEPHLSSAMDPEESPFDYDLFWTALDNAVQALSYDGNKLAVGFTSQPLPTAEETLAMSGELHAKTMAVLNIFLSIPMSSGSHFKSEVHGACVSILESLVIFVQTLKKSCPVRSKDLILQRVGGFWEKCDVVTRRNLSLSNKEACLSVIEKEKSMVDDAVRELEEALADDGEDDDEDTWSSSEREIVRPGLGLMKVAQAALKKVMTGLKDRSRTDTAEFITEMDKSAAACKNLSEVVDDLASCLYPPVQSREIEEKVQGLQERILKAIEQAGKTHFIDKEEFAKWGPFLERALKHNRDKLSKSLLDLDLSQLEIEQK